MKKQPEVFQASTAAFSILAVLIGTSSFITPVLADYPGSQATKLPKVLTTISNVDLLAGGPYILDVNKKTNKVYVANYDDAGTVAVIDGKTNQLTDRITVGDDPNSATVNDKTNKIYATNYVDGSVSVIDGKSNTVVDTIKVGSGHLFPEGCEDSYDCTSGSGPYQAAVNTETNRLYVLNYFDGTVSVIDEHKHQEIAQVSVGTGGYGIAVNPETNRIYLTIPGNNAVTVIDGHTNKIIATVTVGQNPLWLAVNTETNRIYTANGNDDTVSVIDGKTHTLIDTIAIPPGLVPANCTTNCISESLFLRKLI